MVRSKRLKQIKHKRQTNHKRQTKNKRHRQYGGRKYPYNSIDSTTNVLGESVTEPVLIPGYSEILDMMEEYASYIDESQNLNSSIKSKDVKVLTDCSETRNITDEENRNKIIVLRKTSKSFFGYTLGNNTIDCSSVNYHNLASHNFRIFIEEILKWNPFLNQPTKELKKPFTSSYKQHSVHEYRSDPIFINEVWWRQQGWWNKYSITPSFRAVADAAAITVQAAEAAEMKERLVENLKSKIKQLEEEILKLQNVLQEKQLKLLEAQQQPAEQQEQ